MLECISEWLSTMLPEGVHPFDALPTLGFVTAIVLVLAGLIRLVAKEGSGYNHALASAMAILAAYTFLMWVHNENPPEFIREALRILPLIDYKDTAVQLFQFDWEHVLPFCKELLHVFILSLILIGLDDMINDAKNVLAWIILQTAIVILSIFIYWIVIKGINHFMPGLLNSYAPLVLVCILLFMIGLGLAKLILGLLITAVNPLLTEVSKFFAATPFGKAVGKAALCSLILFAVDFFMVHFGYTVFTLVNLTWLVCFLPLGFLVLLWILVGYVIK